MRSGRLYLLSLLTGLSRTGWWALLGATVCVSVVTILFHRDSADTEGYTEKKPVQ